MSDSRVLPSHRPVLKCRNCKKEFRTKPGLRQHHVKYPACRPPQKPKTKTDYSGIAFCFDCKGIFLDINKHNLTFHNKRVPKKPCKKPGEIKPFPCLTCDESFDSPWFLKRHEDYVHKGLTDHRCSDCHESFEAYSLLLDHQTELECLKSCQDEVCDFCHPGAATGPRKIKRLAEKFDSGIKVEKDPLEIDGGDVDPLAIPEVTVKDIMSNAYADLTPIEKCNDCGKKFKNEQKLKKHIVRVHTVFPCNICGKMFTKRAKIGYHIKRSHERARNE